MKNKIEFIDSGFRANIGQFEITRLLPNSHKSHIGHFVFLDFIHPVIVTEKVLNPDAAHPHLGIATLTYILNGEVDHFDSYGNRGTVYSGGVQWMNAGNGIVHNESVGPDTTNGSMLLRGFQFWMNLPSAEKQKQPQYLAIQSGELPVISLPNQQGTLKVVVGNYNGFKSKIPVYSDQVLYHVVLYAGKQFTLNTKDKFEYAAFLHNGNLTVNNCFIETGNLIDFESKYLGVEFYNNSEHESEFLVFGGEQYVETYVAQGPYVLNNIEEIKQAHSGYLNGNYGKMAYNTT